MSLLGQKHVVLSPEIYAALVAKSSLEKNLNPEMEALARAEKDMHSIWDRKDLPPDEKVRIFTDALEQFKRYHGSVTQPKPVPVTISGKEQSLTSEEERRAAKRNAKHDPVEDSIFQVIPKTAQKQTSSLLEMLKAKPSILSWNERGEIVYRGERIANSNIADLVVDSVTNRKSSTTAPFESSVFNKALAELNVPTVLIKNNARKYAVELAKSGHGEEDKHYDEAESDFKSPFKDLRTPKQ